jgi:hypothetical protein
MFPDGLSKFRGSDEMIRTNELKIPWIFPKENVSPQFPKREEGTTHGEQAGTIAKVANRPTNVLPPDVHLRVEPPLAEQSIEDFAANGVLTIRGGRSRAKIGTPALTT